LFALIGDEFVLGSVIRFSWSWSGLVRKRSNNFPPALKHGVYSGLTLLPGEDETAFKELHDGLIAEFGPTGPLEEDIVETLASLKWRKANLWTYRLAQLAQHRHSAIWEKTRPPCNELMPLFGPPAPDERSPEEIRAAIATAEKETEEELGDVMELIEMGREVTLERLFEEFSVIERLDGMIERCIKRLLLVRGVKSMACSPSFAPSPSRKRRHAAEDAKSLKIAPPKRETRKE
jgi:hypothetical protein